MKNLTIRAKITIWFIALLILSVGLTYAMFFYVAESVVHDEEQSDLMDVVDWDAEAVRWSDTMENFGELNPGEYHVEYGSGYLIIDDDFVGLLGGVGTGIFDSSGKKLFGNDLIPDVSRTTPFLEGKLQSVDSGEDRFFVYDRQIRIEGVNGLWARGAVDQAQMHSEFTRIRNIGLIFLPLLILLAAIGEYILTRRSLQPLTQIAQTARSISGGSDLKRRIVIDPQSGKHKPEEETPPAKKENEAKEYRLPAKTDTLKTDDDGGSVDRDEVRQLANSFNDMMQRLEESFASEKRFTSDVSHELRTPMTAILGQCELCLEYSDHLTEEEAREALELIRRQGKRMNELIEDMLTYTRIDRHHEKYPFEDADLSALTEEICGEYALIQEQDEGEKAKNITVKSEIESDLHVHGNDILLGRMLSNLISNGIRYGKKGGNVRVRLQKTGGNQILLEVEDDGIGIAPEDLPEIFNRFYQADPARSGEGNGLGLSMVKEIVSIHGGSIKVSSEPGKGSVFTVVMPAL